MLTSLNSRSPLSRRDPRIDVLRGIALFMIFIDHIPYNALAQFTLRNYALCDAAEVFVLLAGFSAALAYGRAIDRDGLQSGVRRIVHRCGRIYLAQVGLFLATLFIGQLWNWAFDLSATVFAPVMRAPLKGVLLSFVLLVQPDYLNILPLYVALLAAFPLIWLALRIDAALALILSAALWLMSGLYPMLNLPNWTSDAGWYFNPFAWQFLLTIGVVMARSASRDGGNLRWDPALGAAAAGFLLLSLPQTSAWRSFGLPAPWSFALDASDKTHLAWPRVLSIVAIAYLVFASGRIRQLAGSALLAPLQRCGRHSLEVFVAGCLFALFGRLLFRVTDHGIPLQLLVNAGGFGAMVLTASWMERETRQTRVPARWLMAFGRSPASTSNAGG